MFVYGSFMLILQSGNYSGQVLEYKHFDGWMIGRIAYGSDSPQSPWHYHENAHISFFLQGSCLEQNEQGNTICRTTGDILFMHSGQAHQITTVVPGQNLNLEISASFLNRFDLLENLCDQQIARHPFARTLLIQLYREWLQDDVFSLSSTMLLLDLLGDSVKEQKYTQFPPWLAKIQERIRDQWQCPPSLMELANLAQMHPVTISKGFHHYMGRTLGEYIRYLKIEQAIRLIHSTNDSLSQIAFECGFADQSHFIRTFRKLTGFLPSAYKKR